MTAISAAQRSQLDHRDHGGRFTTLPAGEAAGVQLIDIDHLFDDPAASTEPDASASWVYATTDPALANGTAELIGQTWAPRQAAELVDPDAVVDDTKIAYVTVRGSGYEFKQLEGITDDEEHRYTADRCGYLAVALHERTGWPLVVFADGYDHDSPPPHPGWVHAGVLAPDGRFLDVNGPVDWSSHWDKWVEYVDEDLDEATVEEIDPELFASNDFTPNAADRDVADRALKALGLGHLARTEA